MSRILLADDSPNAQRMGEWILREEGYEVVSVTDGETALIRLSDVSPDVVLADVFLPHVSGYDLCREIKSRPELRHARVVLLAGMLERVDEAEAARVKADGILRKPFEASVVAATVRPLAEAATAERESALPVTPVAAAAPAAKAKEPEAEPAPEPEPVAEGKAEEAAPPAAAEPPDPEIVRAAVTIALDLAMPAMIDELTERVVAAMGKRG
jgi:CheY-like chemotaxis protein